MTKKKVALIFTGIIIVVASLTACQRSNNSVVSDRQSTGENDIIETTEQAETLARMLKASLPNEWSYELAEKVVRDYVQRNFADKGMCADWAIHDSEYLS